MEYLAVGLLKLMDMESGSSAWATTAMGETCYRSSCRRRPRALKKKSARSCRPMVEDTPEAFECLFKVLNASEFEVPTVLVILSDSIPHGMKEYEGKTMAAPSESTMRRSFRSFRASLIRLSRRPDAAIRMCVVGGRSDKIDL